MRRKNEEEINTLRRENKETKEILYSCPQSFPLEGDDTKRIVITKHCQYHQNYNHNIDECVALKDKSEELIQAGYLRRFVQNRTLRSPMRSPRRSSRRGEHIQRNRSKSPRGQRESRRGTPI